MPLDVARLRQSELASDETPEACWAAVLLWCAAWHEIPAGSIPNNEQWQAKQAGYVARGKIDKAWDTVKEGALRGFVLCSDGRLYHEVVAEKARESWESKLRHAHGKMCERMRKVNKARAENSLDAVHVPTFDEWISAGKTDPVPPEGGFLSGGKPPEKPLKGEGKGEGEGIKKKPTASSTAKLPTCPTQGLIDLYHELLPTLPSVRLQTESRTKALRKAWEWCLTSKRPDNTRRAESAEQALAWFRDYFERAGQNDFLMGRTPRSGEHANWRCDLDFLLTERGMKHVIEKTLEAA